MLGWSWFDRASVTVSLSKNQSQATSRHSFDTYNFFIDQEKDKDSYSILSKYKEIEIVININLSEKLLLSLGEYWFQKNKALQLVLRGA